MKQDLAEKIAQETAKKTAQAEAAAKKKIEKLENAAKKKTAAAEKREAKQAAAAAKKAAKSAAKVSAAEKKAAAQVAKANKKAAAQSEKAAKLAAKRQAKEGPMENGEAAEEGGKKKKGGKKILLLFPVVAIVAGVAVFFFLRGRGGGEAEDAPLEPVTAPVEYLFEEETPIPALPVWGEDVLVYQENIVPPETASTESDSEEAENAEGAEGAEDGEEESEEPAATAIQYTYEGLQDPKALLSAYAALLTTEDAGFSAVDDELVRIDLPDFEGKAAEEGQEAVPPATSVHLARNGTGEESVIHSLRLSWEGDRCVVIVDTPEGRVRNPQPAAGQVGGAVAPGLTVEGFRTLSPSVLGLPGSSMDEYNVYVQDGTILVYGSTCIRLSVYAKSASGSNEIAGNYFLSADGQHLYKYDLANNSVEELEIED